MALQQFRIDGKANNQQEAIEQLTLALAHWEDPTDSIEKYNVAEMPNQFDADFSWRMHIREVENDIKIAAK